MQSPRHPTGVWVGEDEGQTALLVDGVVQSVLVTDGPLGPGYWPHMLPDVRPARALILGFGGGTICQLILRRFGPVEIVGVECDARVLRLARSAFGMDQPTIQIVEGDAFAYVEECQERFDYVAVDLFAEGAIPRQIFARPFLRKLRSVVTPGGLVAINFFKDRRLAERQHRVESVFPRVAFVESGKNVIARCRPR